MKLSGKRVGRREILEKTGNIAQIAGARQYRLEGGYARNMKAIDVITGSGLNFTVLPERGMDISLANYKGVNISYITSNGETDPAFYEPEGIGWLRTFTGGLLTTCGLRSFGPPCNDENEEFGLHGRYSTIPAKQVCDSSHWEKDDYIVEVSGIVEECRIFGDKIRLTRTIRAIAGEKSFRIEDEIENFGFKAVPFMILYHFNIGFPMLDYGAELKVESSECIPRDEEAKKGMKNKSFFSDPIKDFKEQCYTYKMKPGKSGRASATLVNRKLCGGLELRIGFNTDELPFMTQWKMMGQSEYVLGMEPCNVQLDTRANHRAKKTLPFIEPGEKKNINLEVSVLEKDGF